jgi:hypothetical protein
MKIEMAVPKFELTLPSTGEKIKFRPFVMREEKLLLFASEANGDAEVIGAVDEIVRNCTFNAVSVDTHPVFDLIYVFLQIRAKSVGELVEFFLVCGDCGHKTDATLDITKLEVKKNPDHKTTIMLSDTVGIKMRYPRLSETVGASRGDIDFIYATVINCMDSIFTEDEVYHAKDLQWNEKAEFLDGLTAEQFEKIQEFFDTMPKLTHTMEYVCPKCQKQNVASLDGLLSFFD